MYVAADFHYLQGLRLDTFDATLQFETDSLGLLVPNPRTPPFTLEWETSSSGHGMAVNAGVSFVVNRWDFGLGVGGIGNHITWTDIRPRYLSLLSLFGGADFVYINNLPKTDERRRLELPVTYTADVAYHRENWSVFTEASKGYMGDQARVGLEYRPAGQVELRGAVRYYDGTWYTSGGAGVNLGRNLGVDVALYGTKTFLERSVHLGMAISFRIDKR